MTTAVCPFLNFGFYLGLLDRDLGVTRKCCKGWFRWLNWTAKAVRHRPSYSRYFSFGHFMTRRPAMAQDKPGSSRTLDLHLSLLGDLELGLDAGFFLARPFERWATQPRFLHCLFFSRSSQVTENGACRFLVIAAANELDPGLLMLSFARIERRMHFERPLLFAFVYRSWHETKDRI